MRKAIAGVLMGAAVLSLAACGKSDTAQTTAAQAAESADSTAAAVDTEDKKEIVYGKSQGPYTELFEAAIVPILEKEGYTVKGVDFSDLQTADIGLNDGDVDVNVEQHAAYAENFNANYNADLVPISPIPTVLAGVYSAKYTSVDEIPDGAKVAVPNDASNTARCYLMLQKIGWIKLADDVDPSAVTQDDIVDFGRSQSVLITDDGIAAGSFVQGIAGTDDLGITDIGTGILVSIDQVIFADGFLCPFQRIVNTHQLGRLSPVSRVAATDGQNSTTRAGLYRSSQRICSRFGRAARSGR